MKYPALRQEIIRTAYSFGPAKWSIGTFSNISARMEHGYLHTVTGVSCTQLRPSSIVESGEIKINLEKLRHSGKQEH